MTMNKNAAFMVENFPDEKKYWLYKLAGELNPLEFPVDMDINPDINQEEKHHIQEFEMMFAKNVTSQVLRISNNNDLSLYVFLLAVFKLFCLKYSGQNDIITASPGYAADDLKTNEFILLRDYLEPGMSFVDTLMAVKETVSMGYRNQHYPLETIFKHLGLERKKSSFLRIVVTMENIHNKEEAAALIHSPSVDIAIGFDHSPAGLRGRFIYNSRLFKKETIQKISAGFQQILIQVLNNTHIKISQVELISPEEKNKVLFEFNKTRTAYPRDKAIHQLFEEQVGHSEDHIAVKYEDNNLTYAELNRQANQWARMLRGKGVRPDVIVALKLERSMEMITGIFGILKAGGAYLPVDPAYPPQRITYMLQDSSTKFLVTDTETGQEIGFRGETIMTDHLRLSRTEQTDLSCINNPRDLAYVIYTSGSTGIPKGVLISHRNVIAYVYTSHQYYRLGPDETRTQQSSFSFDQFVEEVYLILFEGGTLLILEKYDVHDIDQLRQILEKNRVTLFSAPPAVMNEVNKYPLAPSIRRIILGGDVLKKEHIDNILKKVPVYNFYGPTETSVCAAIYHCPADIEGTIPIGKANANYQVYILDRWKNPVPVHRHGEIYISGDGVGRGYLNNPLLTQEKFLVNPFLPHQRMFRTGDLGKFLPDGDIEYLGRIDRQVKIRGYRIELGEIQSRLLKHPHIQDAVVVVRDRDYNDHSPEQTGASGKYICAYIISERNLMPVELREFLSVQIPGYMMPAYFIQVDNIPLTSNNKVNIAALPEPGSESGQGQEYCPPRDKKEEIIAQLWSQILGLKTVGILDNFFEIGGDSIKAISVSSRLRKHNLKLKVKDLFAYPTISQLSQYIEDLNREIDQGPVQGEVVLSPIQRWFFETQPQARHHFNFSRMLYKEDGFDTHRLEQVFSTLVEHHDALRMVFRQDSGEMTQWNRGLEEKPFDLQVFDLEQETNIQKKILEYADQIQQSINLETGPLVKLGLFKTSGGHHLLIVIHHLVMDAVSWRILMDQFQVAYKQALNNEKIHLPEKTDSYQHWSRQLLHYAESPAALKELPYWEKIHDGNWQQLPTDHEIKPEMKRVGNWDSYYLVLPEEQTGKLLKEVNSAYNTEINDILLTALAMAVKNWANIETIVVNLEGHGREDILEDIDVSRTVGWFTSQFPVVFNAGKPMDISNLIIEIKETLRQIPNKGIGYGILKYLTPDEKKQGVPFNRIPPISFNYLGQFDNNINNDNPGMIKGSPMKAGNNFNPVMKLEFTIVIEGLVEDGKLFLSFAYNRLEYEKTSIKTLTDAYKTNLIDIINHCAGKKDRASSPSDYDVQDMDQEDLDEVLNLVESV